MIIDNVKRMLCENGTFVVIKSAEKKFGTSL